MPPSRKQLANELQEALDENDLRGFRALLDDAKHTGHNLDASYGAESSHKTILHLALEEDDGYPYVEELLIHGASASHYNSRLGTAPIHVAVQSTYPDIFKLLVKYPDNRADVNVPNKDGLTAFHLILGKLMDLAALENKSIAQRNSNTMTDARLEEEMLMCLDCLIVLANQKDLRIDFDNAVSGIKTNNTNFLTVKKLSTMTPLQILCSFQTWNARTVSDPIHNSLEKLVGTLLDKGIDPNATAAKGALPGTVPGSTPGVLLAATRGYYKVVDVFKGYYSTNFLLENKFQQTILHIVIKAGYYNKIVVHGDESGFVNIKTIHCLFAEHNLVIQQQMKSIINRQDSYGNTALHYAKQYPDQSIVKFLLGHGAKIDVNPQKVVNINSRTLEEYFYETCIIPEGDDIDDEDFRIKINFKLFEKPLYGENDNLEVAREKANAWTLEMEKEIHDVDKKPTNALSSSPPSSGYVDTRRLEYFSDIDSLHVLLKHPLLTSFLELELNSLKWRYFFDFLFYLAFVFVLFTHLGNRYGIIKVQLAENGEVFKIDTMPVTYYVLILFIFIVLLFLRELYQIVKQKKRYFQSPENYIEWFVIALVVLNILPSKIFWYLGNNTLENQRHAQRHVAALTLLIAFMQLYLLLVRVVPNTPIPIYINMFTTVLKTYTFILMSYMAFIMSFAYSFFLMFSDDHIYRSKKMNGTANATTDHEEEEDLLFGNIGYALVKTLVMFIGEMDYTDLNFTHWLGYVIFVLFAFLLIIVLMNILNGLAVSDIHKIQEEVDTYYHISIVETLASTSFVSLLAEEVILYPNIRPEHPKILGIPIPGLKVYHAKGGKENDDKPKRDLTFSENTVKAAKELVALKQQQNQSLGKVTLENIGDNIMDMKREQAQLKAKLVHLDDTVKTILEIMVSRQPMVERL